MVKRRADGRPAFGREMDQGRVEIVDVEGQMERADIARAWPQMRPAGGLVILKQLDLVTRRAQNRDLDLGRRYPP